MLPFSAFAFAYAMDDITTTTEWNNCFPFPLDFFLLLCVVHGLQRGVHSWCSVVDD